MQNQFLLRVLASVLPEGKGVDWKKVNMPNRTPKSLQHQWTTVVAQMRDLNVGGDGALPAKPRTRGSPCPSPAEVDILTNISVARKKAVSKKAVAKAAAEGDDGEDDGEDDGKDGEEEKKKPVTPKKRGAAANSGGMFLLSSKVLQTLI